MPDPIAPTLKDASQAVKDWGLPLLGFVAGMAVGDAIGLTELISTVAKEYVKDAKIAGLFAAGIYLLIGLALYFGLDGMVGHVVGMAFVGMAARTAYEAAQGK